MIAEDLLKEKGIKYQISGKDAKIHCLNPEHDDTNPSMRVDRITGVSLFLLWIQGQFIHTLWCTIKSTRSKIT